MQAFIFFKTIVHGVFDGISNALFRLMEYLTKREDNMIL